MEAKNMAMLVPLKKTLPSSRSHSNLLKEVVAPKIILKRRGAKFLAKAITTSIRLTETKNQS